MSRRTLTRCLLAAVCLTAMAIPASATASNPFRGNAMWIWYMNHSGGSAAAVAKKAKAHNIRTVFVKSSDGTNGWSQFTPGLVRALHAKGIKVCGWQFVYGTSPGLEARRGADAYKDGADCLIIDAESAYEGNYIAADRYMTLLRQLSGKRKPLAIAGFPYADYHPSFPYSVFMRPGGAQFNTPQVYWKAIGVSVKEALEHTYVYNRPYDTPIYPIGQTYDDPPRHDFLAFRRQAKAYGTGGVSWWVWQDSSAQEFNWIGKNLTTDAPKPTVTYPVLHRGSRGDLVIQLQEYLRAAGQNAKVNGFFSSKTKVALANYQKRHHLKASGRSDLKTWRKLQRHNPVIVHWATGQTTGGGGGHSGSGSGGGGSDGGVGTGHKRALAIAPHEPGSAALEPLGLEFASTPGHP